MIKFQDSTIRDGMQQQKITKNFDTKLKVLDLIGKSNVDSIEIGMCTTEEDIFLIKKKCELIENNKQIVILTRMIEDEIILISQLKNEIENLTIKLLIPISDLHIFKKLGTTRELLCEKIEKCLELTNSLNIATDVCLEDATRADNEFLFNILNIIDRYKVNFVTIADTVGFCTPREYGNLIRKIKNANYKFLLSTHCHNDLGLATANTIEGILNGATQIEGTFLGIGERAGNAAIDEICYILKNKYEFNFLLNNKEIYEISKKIEKIINYKSSVLKPITGENAFIHESGIHQHGIQKDKKMYQFVLPDEIGISVEKKGCSITGISSSKLIKNYIEEKFGQVEDIDDVINFYKKFSKINYSITIEDSYYLYLLDKQSKSSSIQILSKENIDYSNVIAHMREGNPVIIPTDTNYNLACLPKSEVAVDKIFKYKKRPKNKALSLFFLEPSDWKKYGVTENNRLMEIIVNKFWPGALNIVVNKTSSDFDYMLNGSETVSLGCISNPTWRTFVEKIESPIAITSANISGTVDDMLVTKEIAIEQMGASVRYFIESEFPILNSKSSTIIAIENKGVKILREGDITCEILDSFLREEGFSAYR